MPPCSGLGQPVEQSEPAGVVSLNFHGPSRRNRSAMAVSTAPPRAGTAWARALAGSSPRMRAGASPPPHARQAQRAQAPLVESRDCHRGSDGLTQRTYRNEQGARSAVRSISALTRHFGPLDDRFRAQTEEGRWEMRSFDLSPGDERQLARVARVPPSATPRPAIGDLILHGFEHLPGSGLPTWPAAPLVRSGTPATHADVRDLIPVRPAYPTVPATHRPLGGVGRSLLSAQQRQLRPVGRTAARCWASSVHRYLIAVGCCWVAERPPVRRGGSSVGIW
jgi:hypothetical protein